MTASWTMEASAAAGKHVSLAFYSGPAAPPPKYFTLRGTVVDGSRRSERSFHNQQEADEWAAELGVDCWYLIRHSRGFPEASQIPIRFAEAPDDERLKELIRVFESGTPLKDLVNGVMVHHEGREFQVHPNLLRLWLIGAVPDHPALQRLKFRS